MPIDSIIVSAFVVAVFAGFAVVLFLVDRKCNQPADGNGRTRHRAF